MSIDTIERERFLQLERQVTQHGHAINVLQPGFPVSATAVHRKLALPIALGSFSIGATTWFLGLLVLHTRGVTMPNAWIINGVPMGACLTILSGIGEAFTGNTFGCTLFICVGSIIGGLAYPFLPITGIQAAFAKAANGNAEEAHVMSESSSGIYLLCIWGLLFILLIASHRTAVVFMMKLVFINIVAITFGLANMTGNAACLQAAGVFLLLVAIGLFYTATSLLLVESGHPFASYMPLGSLEPKSKQPKQQEKRRESASSP